MNDLTKAYADAAKVKEDFLNGAKARITEFFPFVILVLNVVFAIFSCLFSTGLVNPFTPRYFIDLVSNILMTMFAYVSFVQYGEKIEKLAEAYITNCRVWSEISERVRQHHSEDFQAYCIEQTNKEREDRRREMILNKTMIPYEVYLSEYRSKSREDIKALAANGVISKSDARVVNRANGNIKVKPLRPLLIFSGIHLAHINDAGRKSVPVSVISIASRPVIMLVSTAVLKMFTGSYVGVESASVVYDMMYSVMLIIVSSFVGFSAGTKSAKVEHEKIKARIFFLEGFEKSKA